MCVSQTVLHEVGSVGLLQLLDAAAAEMDTWQRMYRLMASILHFFFVLYVRTMCSVRFRYEAFLARSHYG